MKRLHIAILIVLLTASSVFAGEKVVFNSEGFAPMFPFSITKGAPDNITNVRTWSTPKPAGADGFLRIEGDHFVSDKGPVRFVGTNLCFTASFPNSHEDAERLAKTLARFGINAVRLHHMDSYVIWGGRDAKNHLDISPEALEKLDYLIYQLELNGVYVNINLHVSRQLDERDGMVNGEGVPNYDKGLDNFQPQMIEYQKKYAKDLLTHVNPYTKKAYVDDPGIAMIEINNENSVLCSWSGGHLDNLPEPYATDFRTLWNAWLSKKYKSTAELKAAWECRTIPFGENMIPDGGFTMEQFSKRGSHHWEVQRDEVCDVPADVVDDSALESGKALKIQVNKMGGVDWVPQLHRNGLSSKNGMPYTIRFKCKATAETELSVGMVEQHDPWSTITFRKSFKVGKNWKTYEYTFVADRDDAKVRISFGRFQPGNAYWFGDVSLVPGGVIGIADSESLEQGTVSVPKKNGLGFSNAVAQQDFADFLYDIEKTYWVGMYNYIKSLGAKQPVTGTQLQYGYWNVQAQLDYCDIHAYWNHPVFPGRPWDGNNWYVRNRALVNAPADRSSTLNRLAAVRVMNKPLTVSEYDHPFPNPYCAEGNLMAYSIAAFQDWSGIFQFAWRHNNEYDPPICNAFFDMASNVGKTAHLPACYGIFARADVKAAGFNQVQAPIMTIDKEKNVMANCLYGYHRNLDALGLNYSLPWAVRTGVVLPDTAGVIYGQTNMTENINAIPEKLGGMNAKWIRSETGELYCDFQTPDKGFFTVSAPKAKAFTGFVNGRTFDLGALSGFGKVTLKPAKTRQDWITFTMVEAKPNRYLIAATALVVNTDMDLEDLGDGRWTCGSRWGQGPTLCEGVPASLIIDSVSDADSVTVYALDGAGNRVESVPVRREGAGVVIELDPKYKTVWYEMVITQGNP